MCYAEHEIPKHFRNQLIILRDIIGDMQRTATFHSRLMARVNIVEDEINDIYNDYELMGRIRYEYSKEEPQMSPEEYFLQVRFWV